jgi:hypothetical protein
MIPVFRQFKRYARFRGSRPIPEIQPGREELSLTDGAISQHIGR